MPALTGPALVAAMLLVLAGAQKVIDPAMTAGALRQMRLPGAPALVRVGSAAEVVLGVVAIAYGGWLAWSLVAASFAIFAIFVFAALRSGHMIGSCGCFGREETPPHALHVILNVAMAVVAGIATQWDRAPIVAVGGDVATGAMVVMGAAAAVAASYALYVELPRLAAHREALRGLELSSSSGAAHHHAVDRS